MFLATPRGQPARGQIQLVADIIVNVVPGRHAVLQLAIGCIFSARVRSQRNRSIQSLPPLSAAQTCDGLSPGISMDGETIMYCPVCHDTGKVTPDQAEAWEERIRSLNKGDNA